MTEEDRAKIRYMRRREGQTFAYIHVYFSGRYTLAELLKTVKEDPDA